MKTDYRIAIGLAIGTFAAILLAVGLRLVSDIPVFSQDLITILIAVLAVSAAGFFAKALYGHRADTKRIEQDTDSESRILKTAERETEDSNFDPSLYHLTAVLFYPKDTPKKDRVPSKSLPQRGIMNWSTKKVYYMNKEADDLLLKRRINWNTRDWISEEDFAGFFEKQGFELIRRPANPPDLEKAALQEDKPEAESRGGFGIPFYLSGLELIPDKTTYNVGDRIKGLVRVLSLSPGITTVRLISPSGKEFGSMSTEFHLSDTIPFDFGVVEQSWEKGVYRVNAKQGTMRDEQEIKIW